jgi:hypothetical protein
MRSGVGEKAGPYTDCGSRIGFIFATGADEGTARASLEKAQQAIKIVTR